MNKLLIGLISIISFVSCDNSEIKAKNKQEKLKLLATPADTASAEPYLFTDRKGQVFLSWIEKKGKMSFLRYARLKNEEWTAPSMITSGEDWFVNWADYPMLASDGDNNLVAHILKKSGSGTYAYDVMLLISADQGSSWSTPRIIHDDGKKAEHGFVSMEPFGENYLISWLDGRNTASETKGDHHGEHMGSMSIRAAIIDKKGNKTGEWELDNKVCDCCQTSAAITSNGPVVVYRDRSDTEIRDISIVRMINGQWTAPMPIFTDNWKINGCPVNGPRADAKGNDLVVAWFTAPDKNAQVNLVFSSDGGATFGAPIRIDEGKGIGRVDVVMMDDKSAMVSWMEGAVIKAVRVYQDGKKEPAITIASSTESRSSGFPQMTRSGNNLIFAWTNDKEKLIKVAKLSL